MAVDAQEFMSVASEMVKDGGGHEIFLRCAGSRAYYALYHTALEIIADKGQALIKVDKAGSHASVIATLSKMGPSAKSIGEAMSSLRRFRNDCDYELDRIITQKKTELSVAQAQVLIEKLGRL